MTATSQALCTPSTGSKRLYHSLAACNHRHALQRAYNGHPIHITHSHHHHQQLHDQFIFYSFLPQSRMIQSTPPASSPRPGFSQAQTPPPGPPPSSSSSRRSLLSIRLRIGVRHALGLAHLAVLHALRELAPLPSLFLSSPLQTNVPSTWQTSDPSAHGARQPGAAPP